MLGFVNAFKLFFAGEVYFSFPVFAPAKQKAAHCAALGRLLGKWRGAIAPFPLGERTGPAFAGLLHAAQRWGVSAPLPFWHWAAAGKVDSVKQRSGNAGHEKRADRS